MGTLSDRINVKFGSLDSNTFRGAGGGEKDGWDAGKWDLKKVTYLQLKFGTCVCMCVSVLGEGRVVSRQLMLMTARALTHVLYKRHDSCPI